MTAVEHLVEIVTNVNAENENKSSVLHNVVDNVVDNAVDNAVDSSNSFVTTHVTTKSFTFNVD